MFFSKSKSIVFLMFLFWGCKPVDTETISPTTPKNSNISIADSLLATADSNIQQIKNINNEKKSYIDSLSKTLTYEEYLIKQFKHQLKENSLQIDTLTIENTNSLNQSNLKTLFISILRDSISSHISQRKNLQNKIQELKILNKQYQMGMILYKDSLDYFKDSLHSIPKYKKKIKRNEKTRI